MGDAARRVIERHASSSGDMSPQSGVKALNEYLFDELGFTGNRDKAEDPRNGCLNEVLERRTGIPLTLSIVYMEVARRAGLQVDGINFPGHFLVRCPQAPRNSSSSILPFRRAAVGAQLPAAVAETRRQRGCVQPIAAGPGHAQPDPRADAAQPEAHLRSCARFRRRATSPSCCSP